MKRNVINCSLMMIILLNACKKEQEVTQAKEKIEFDIYDKGPQEYGSLTALKNGIKWNASGFSGFYSENAKTSGVGFSGYTYFSNNYKDLYVIEKMNFSLIPFAIGKYKLRQFSFSNYIFKEGEALFRYGYYENDVEVNPFELVEEADNYIEVTKIDSLHLEGRFDVTCKGKYKIKDVTHIYRFSEGTFNVLFRK
jgi:hypothetical protein